MNKDWIGNRIQVGVECIINKVNPFSPEQESDYEKIYEYVFGTLHEFNSYGILLDESGIPWGRIFEISLANEESPEGEEVDDEESSNPPEDML